MGKNRAKKKQRQRARRNASAGSARRDTPGTTAPSAARRTRSDAAVSPITRRPSRLDVRDGVPRPDAIWAPFPLTEIGMAVGIVLCAIGFSAGTPALLVAGVGVLVVAVTELCLREHFSGFRSHSLLLAMLPVTVVHLAVVLAGVSWRGPLALAVDLAVAAALAWWLMKRFRTAQSSARRRLA